MAIVARLEERFGIPIPVRTLFEEPTVGDLAAWIDRQRDTLSHAAEIVRLQGGSGTRPLFVLPGGRADAAQLYGLAKLARALDPGRAVYAFPGDPPVAAAMPPAAWVGAAAETLVTAMRTVQPRGPYLLFGVCVGGVFAWEMARQLAAAGERVQLLLYDTRHPRLHLGEGTFRHAVADALSPAERRARHRTRRAWRGRQLAAGAGAAANSLRTGKNPGARRIVMTRAYDPGPLAGRVQLLVNWEWHRVSSTLGWERLLGDRLQVTVARHGHGPEWDVAHVAAWLRQGLAEEERAFAPAPSVSPNGHAKHHEREPEAGRTVPATNGNAATVIDARDLGADSMQIARMVAALRDDLHLDLAPGVLFEQRTPARLAAWLAAALPGETGNDTPPVPLAGVARPPVFFLAGRNGQARPLRPSRLMADLDPARSFHELVVRQREDAGSADAGESARRAAQRCLGAVRAEQPNGPFLVVGIGDGITVARQLAEILRAEDQPSRVLLFVPADSTERDCGRQGDDGVHVAPFDPMQRPRPMHVAAAEAVRAWLAEVEAAI